MHIWESPVWGPLFIAVKTADFDMKDADLDMLAARWLANLYGC